MPNVAGRGRVEVMRWVWRRCVIPIAALVLVAGCESGDTLNGSPLASEGHLSICLFGPNDPYLTYDERLRVTGLDAEVLAAMSDRLGLEERFVDRSGEGVSAFTDPQTCELAAGGFRLSQQSRGTIDFTAPYVFSYPAIMVSADSGIVDADDLRGQTVLAVAGSSWESVAVAEADRLGVVVETRDDLESALAAVDDGQAAGILSDVVLLDQLAEDSGDRYRIAERLTSISVPLAFALPIEVEPRIRDAINDAIADLDDDGTLDDIASRWIR